MAYRSGTYVVFHAAGTSDPTASDMKYYNLLRAWRSTLARMVDRASPEAARFKEVEGVMVSRTNAPACSKRSSRATPR